jgi:exopolysaccharide biosynthesis protein
MTSNGTLVWVMVAQKPNIANSGLTLEALADFMKTLGIEQAMNLDGGSSSALYYQGKTIYGKIDASG